MTQPSLGDDPLARLAALPRVAEAVERARDACTALRWHPLLRRRMEEARAESAVRGARASAALDGAELPLERVRELLVAQPLSTQEVGGAEATDAVTRHVVGALRATLAAADLGGVLSSAPAQALARLHLAAMSGQDRFDPDLLGRPRPAGTPPRDLVDLGPAPDGPALAQRLDGLGRLLTRPTQTPALVLAAVVHGELLAMRPFSAGNGVVARAVARAVIVARGLDPTGVGVPEVGLLAGGATAYVGAAAAYATGTPDGVALWLVQCADAVELGAREGALLADALRT
ncbi:MAG: oxidoreductase [Actinomycetales bacterium]